MFRGDRIGTPVIHSQTNTQTAAAFTLAATGNKSQLVGNVINPVAVGTFGHINVRWAGAAPIAIAAGTAFGLGQQFTVQKPAKGNVVGYELNGAIIAHVPDSALIIPFLGIYGTAGGAAPFPTFILSSEPTYLTEGRQGLHTDHTLSYRSHSYQTQVIYKDDPFVGKTFIHGFAIFDNSAAGYNFDFFDLSLSLRQNNNEANETYADRLR